jgi:hypothetical protein
MKSRPITEMKSRPVGEGELPTEVSKLLPKKAKTNQTLLLGHVKSNLGARTATRH